MIDLPKGLLNKAGSPDGNKLNDAWLSTNAPDLHSSLKTIQSTYNVSTLKEALYVHYHNLPEPKLFFYSFKEGYRYPYSEKELIANPTLYVEKVFLTKSGGLNPNLLRQMEQKEGFFQENFPLLYSSYYQPNKPLPQLFHELYHKEDNSSCNNPECTNKSSFINFKEGYHPYCSLTCSQASDTFKNKVKQTQQEKFGGFAFDTKEGREKAKQTNLDRYGHEAPQNAEEVKEKAKQTNLERFGHENPMHHPDIKEKVRGSQNGYAFLHNPNREKAKQTNLDRYGHENYLQSEEGKTKFKEASLLKYGTEHPMQSEEGKSKNLKAQHSTYFSKLINHLDTTTLTWIEPQEYRGWFNSNKERVPLKYKASCSKCNQTVDFDIRCRCLTCYPNNPNVSMLEKELLEFIQQNYQGPILSSNRTLISPLEIDIYLPELNLAIEFNGMYWHSGLHKNSEYHKNKTDLALEKGVSLIHIWESDWLNKPNIIKSMLLNKLKVNSSKLYARKCTLSPVTQAETDAFLFSNHLSGSKNSRYRIGLYHNNDLVSVLTATERNGYLEIDRFASLLNHTIVGGFSKLFKNLKKTSGYTNYMTYADRDWSPNPENCIYNTHLEYLTTTPPQLSYWDHTQGILYSRHKFMKHNLPTMFSTYEDQPVDAFLASHDIFSVHRSGNLKYTLTI